MVNIVRQVSNEYTEKKMPQSTALRDTGSYLKRYGESTRNANPRLSVGQVTAKPANVSIRESKGT
jgi:hypothetical protein